MMVVRYPNGQKLTFNDVTNINVRDQGIFLVDSKDNWSAFVQDSAGATIEWIKPCRVENENTELTEARAFQMVRDVMAEGRHAEGCGSEAAEIKKLLRNFNATTWEWK